MAQINPLTRELLVKIVYYGPGLGGKTTSLSHVHEASPVETRGQLVSLATPVDRTLYFDFLPVRAHSVRDHHVRLQLFTVPGQVYFNATRKLVLTGADGVVFVADSQRGRHEANLESMENLAANLEEQGRSITDIPLVLQYNKRDLPDALGVDVLDGSLNALGAPSFGTCATTGEGVMDALDTLVRLVLDDVQRKNALVEAPAPSTLEPTFETADDALAAQVRRATEKLFAGAAESPEPAPPPSPAPGAPEPTRGAPSVVSRSSEPSASPALHGFRGPDGGPSWLPLFPESGEVVVAIEGDIGSGRLADAVLRCEQLARELLLAAGRQAGLSVAVLEPALLAPLVGLEGERWLALSRLARRVRAGGPVDVRDALTAYAMVLEIRLRRDRLLG